MILKSIRNNYKLNPNSQQYENKKKDLSYIDALGYNMALKNKIPFLTGDKEFKDLPNVIFVKTN